MKSLSLLVWTVIISLLLLVYYNHNSMLQNKAYNRGKYDGYSAGHYDGFIEEINMKHPVVISGNFTNCSIIIPTNVDYVIVSHCFFYTEQSTNSSIMIFK